MKNKEKFAKEIIDIACKCDKIAITKDNKIVGSNDIDCEQCLFDIGKSCYGLEQWAESEYVEKPKMTSREEKFLSLFKSKWKYLARGEDKNLYVFDSLPIKETDGWRIEYGTMCDYCYVSKKLFGDMFDFIKWEDEEPWLIEDLKKLEVKDE